MRQATMVGTSVMVVLTVVCCYSVPETLYGDPSGLRSTNLPGEGGIAPLTCDDGGADGGPIKGDAGCPSWSTDIYANMDTSQNGVWNCTATACHGATSLPKFAAGDPKGAYTALQAYTVTGTKLTYINPGSQDPAQSGIVCNLSGKCGIGMPQAPGKELTCGQLETITAWVRCGSPND